MSPEPAGRPAADPELAAAPLGTTRPLALALGYGQAGSRWWTIGTAYADNLHNASDFNLHFAFSQFIADDLEFAVEAAVWYFHQPGDDTGGVSGSMIFRWHFWHAPDYKWSVFGDAGIGILGGSTTCPTAAPARLPPPPRRRLHLRLRRQHRRREPRLQAHGQRRWHHISNGTSRATRETPRETACASTRRWCSRSDRGRASFAPALGTLCPRSVAMHRLRPARLAAYRLRSEASIPSAPA